jgi:outer membrane protein assembly factor BamA
MKLAERCLLMLAIQCSIAGFGGFIFAQNPPQKLHMQEIILKGNHKTKDYILRRELTFTIGDSLTKEDIAGKLEESTENLKRLPLFNFVSLRTHETAAQNITIIVEVTERWYTWLWPIFEISDRNFNAWFENGDYSRVSYGLFLQQENFRGRLEKLHFRIKLGYQQQVSLLYETPYLNKTKTLGTGIELAAARERETGYITENDKLMFYRSDEFLRKTQQVSVFIRYRPQIHISHTLTLGINNYQFSDTLLNLNPAYTGINKNQTLVPVVGYMMKADYRDNRAYPLRGWYVDALVDGFGIFPDADYNFLTLRSSARVHLPLSTRWNLALGTALKLSTGGLKPWFLSQSLGYNRDYVRGYEYNVVDGDHFWTIKSNIRYTVVPERIITINRIRAKQFNTIPYAFYVGLFADAGQVWPETHSAGNLLPGKVLKGVGLGVDFVTYYDKVLRTEISLNGEGKAGFFLHFMAAI